jgi:hypothetical protein
MTNDSGPAEIKGLPEPPHYQLCGRPINAFLSCTKQAGHRAGHASHQACTCGWGNWAVGLWNPDEVRHCTVHRTVVGFRTRAS